MAISKSITARSILGEPIFMNPALIAAQIIADVFRSAENCKAAKHVFLCHCGCGKPVKLGENGKPNRFLNHHGKRGHRLQVRNNRLNRNAIELLREATRGKCEIYTKQKKRSQPFWAYASVRGNRNRLVYDRRVEFNRIKKFIEPAAVDSSWLVYQVVRGVQIPKVANA